MMKAEILNSHAVKIITEEGMYLSDYGTTIIFIPVDFTQQTQLSPVWDKSRTTMKSCSDFLGESLSKIRKYLNSNIYEINSNL